MYIHTLINTNINKYMQIFLCIILKFLGRENVIKMTWISLQTLNTARK